MATADDLVLPKPAIPKTLGVLDVIFAVILLLIGLCGVVLTVLNPAIQEFGQKTMAQANAAVEAKKAADLKALDDRSKAATTDEEKAAIEEERTAIAERPTPLSIQVNPANDLFKNPTYQTYTIASLVLSLIFNVALLVAGIGLIRLAPWGRTTALWWAGLLIAKLVILTGIYFAMIQPIELKVADANLVGLRAEANKPNAPPQAAMAVQFAELFLQLTPVFKILGLLASMVYPVVCLVLLNTRGARAACLPRPAPPSSPENWGTAP